MKKLQKLIHFINCIYKLAYPYTTQYFCIKLLAREVLNVAYFPLNASYLGNT
jgi:hypothetical protein